MKKILVFAVLIAFGVFNSVVAGETPSKPGTSLYFVNLKDGDKVKGPVKVLFGLSGMGIAPAGTEKEGTGHHHLLINRPALGEGEDGSEELNNALPADENHVHFGGGQTEVTVELKPGKHTLQLVLGDMNHVPHNPPVVSPVITITVE